MHHTFLGNDLASWSMALAFAFAAWAALMLVRRVAVRALHTIATRTASQLDDIALAMLASSAKPLLLAGALYGGALALALPAQKLAIIEGVALAGLLLQLAWWADVGVRDGLGRYRARHSGENAAVTTSTAALSFIARMAIWLVAILMVLDNFGVNITTLVASLGIGGIAVALALQSILGDLLSSLSIVLDKPFVVGDFIIVDAAPGTVEYVGLKTTRLRALSGEQIIFSNSDLLKARIHNYQRMQRRRIAFTLRVRFGTPAGKLAALPDMLADIVRRQAQTTLDRAHFKEFGPSSLDFEVVYYVETSDYLTYMNIQQAINLELVACFEREHIAFALPTQTVFLAHARSDEPPATAWVAAPHADLRHDQASHA